MNRQRLLSMQFFLIQKRIFPLLLERPLQVSLIIYSVLAILLAWSVNGALTSLTSDLDFYLSSVVPSLDGAVSRLATELYSNSSYVDPGYRDGWFPTPFYSYLFLAPIWLFGSQFFFGILGWMIGGLSLYYFYSILKCKFKILRPKYELLTMALLPLNFNFLVDSLAVSTMSVAALFVLAGFATNSKPKRTVCFLFAAMTRSNFIIALFCLLLVLLFFRPQGWRLLIYELAPSLVIYILFYAFYYSTYPGSGLNYILFTLYQGLDYAQPLGIQLAKSVWGVETSDQLFAAQIGFKEIWLLLATPRAWAYVLNVWALKTSVTLGFVHEKLFVSNHGFWLTKAWRTIYSLAVAVPGFYSSALLVFWANLSPLERSAYLWSLLYLLANSLLMGDPRYSMGCYFLLVAGLVRLSSSLGMCE